MIEPSFEIALLLDVDSVGTPLPFRNV